LLNKHRIEREVIKVIGDILKKIFLIQV